MRPDNPLHRADWTVGAAYELSVRTHEDPAELCGEIVAPGCGPYCERHAEVAL